MQVSRQVMIPENEQAVDVYIQSGTKVPERVMQSVACLSFEKKDTTYNNEEFDPGSG